MTGDILVRNIDFELLYEQRKAVLSWYFSNTSIPTDIIEGLIRLLDSMLDAAEEEGYFKFPEMKNDVV